MSKTNLIMFVHSQFVAMIPDSRSSNRFVRTVDGYNLVNYPSGKTLVTGSAEDSTLFFFDITSNYMPIGFMKLEAPVKTMAWSNSSVSRS